MFFAVLIALTVAVLLFAISFAVGSLLLDNTIYGHSFAEQIGLCTCRRIIEFHNGTFSATENHKLFTVVIELPLTSNTKENNKG